MLNLILLKYLVRVAPFQEKELLVNEKINRPPIISFKIKKIYKLILRKKIFMNLNKIMRTIPIFMKLNLMEIS